VGPIPSAFVNPPLLAGGGLAWTCVWVMTWPFGEASDILYCRCIMFLGALVSVC